MDEVTWIAEFWEQVVITDHGFEWSGSVVGKYGRFQGVGAHRVAWLIERGPIPDGLEIDHEPTCPRICVTVEHMTLRTKSEHTRVGWERGELDGGWSKRPRAVPRQPKPPRVYVPTGPLEPTLAKVCQNCDAPFVAKLDKAQYCSTNCKESARTKRLYPQIEDRICVICDSAFTPQRKDKITCSKQCGVTKANRLRSQEKFEARGGEAILALRPCLWCKEDFVPANRTMAERQKFCSQACGNMERSRPHEGRR